MSIRIVNLRTYKLHPDEVLIKVDRSTPVGNPFYMKDESMRDEVCWKYDNHFPLYMQNNKAFNNYIKHIVNVAKEHDVALGCWCHPNRCHAETIETYVMYELQQNCSDCKHFTESPEGSCLLGEIGACPHNEWWK